MGRDRVRGRERETGGRRERAERRSFNGCLECLGFLGEEFAGCSSTRPSAKAVKSTQREGCVRTYIHVCVRACVCARKCVCACGNMRILGLQKRRGAGKSVLPETEVIIVK